LGNLNSTEAKKLSVEGQSFSPQFAPHARQMPAILVITNEAAKMQPDAIEPTQLGGLQFVIYCHIPVLRNRKEFLTMGGTKVPYFAVDQNERLHWKNCAPNEATDRLPTGHLVGIGQER
jgi:hypothetical protein